MAELREGTRGRDVDKEDKLVWVWRLGWGGHPLAACLSSRPCRPPKLLSLLGKGLVGKD